LRPQIHCEFCIVCRELTANPATFGHQKFTALIMTTKLTQAYANANTKINLNVLIKTHYNATCTTSHTLYTVSLYTLSAQDTCINTCTICTYRLVTQPSRPAVLPRSELVILYPTNWSNFNLKSSSHRCELLY